ncbi:hypothetical protein NXT08_24645 (plasmid) [Rhodococcus pyridinivorans]|uniref:hypothetical protein n=1 Tax=Rhodococcus pyridinivorans TaxID=103816 RepID=UPI002164B62D|nr:hypothetical protein [Rhodococcus pyridinivorans]UVT27771.1 hypothetical protein NXT08_24645 [Rhodococcus pyridinivorans]
MHTWTVTCDPHHEHTTGTTGTAATEVAAVAAGAAALRRLIRATPHLDHAPFLNLLIDARPCIGITAGAEHIEDALERIDQYEYDATLAAAVDDSILGCLDAETNGDPYLDE